MKTELEQQSPTRCKLTIEVQPDEFAPHYESTFKRLAQQVKVPGFRKGKVPRAVLESRIGREAIDEEFLQDAMATFYQEAIQKESLRAITHPDLTVEQFDQTSGLTFTAAFDILPEVKLPELAAISAVRPPTEATDEEVLAQIDRLRDRVATLEAVGRNATKGDFVTMSLHGSQHDVPLEDLGADDLLYEVGSSSFVPQLDVELEGKRAGDILRFNSVLPDEREVTFKGIVKEVQVKRLPELDDELAKTCSEFDTLEELKGDLSLRIGQVKSVEADMAVRSQILDQVVDLAGLDLPESMLAAETQFRLTRLITEVESSGATIEQYLEASKISQDELVERFRESSAKQVAADLILDKVAEQENLQLTKQDLDDELEGLARRTGEKPEDILRQLGKSGRVNALAGDILRRKALDFLVEHADITDEANKEL
ncbi:MAG: trigger factor [Actinomycetota bacterium]